MSHLLKEYRGRIDLIYIDPPFDSKADYKKKIEVRGVGTAESDVNSFEEKQYGDIWTNDEYLQFMYERLLVMRELLSDQGAIYIHVDHHKAHHIRLLMDEVFGATHFQNDIIWRYSGWNRKNNTYFNRRHDTFCITPKRIHHTSNLSLWNGNLLKRMLRPESKKYSSMKKREKNMCSRTQEAESVSNAS